MNAKEEREKIAREMALPEGKTCKNCAWYSKCLWFLGASFVDVSTKCDWHPSRFREVTDVQQG
jgi:hypothetical protein